MLEALGLTKEFNGRVAVNQLYLRIAPGRGFGLARFERREALTRCDYGRLPRFAIREERANTGTKIEYGIHQPD